ncbi:P2X purinoceptor 7 [Chelonia mydas]|uniref:P2X purinoceptor 7 n=1 Tax=Chelonia mydas TaxID=8469 RepID=M7BMZ5_CHEMY|nr:P2X purinoceptor 7 [Chelonia mydas]
MLNGKREITLYGSIHGQGNEMYLGWLLSLKNLCEYETSKVVRFQSVSYGSLKWTFHMIVFLYVCYVLVTDKRYQKKDSVISSVHTKVKGVVQTDSRIWDTAEYTIPMQYPIAKAVCSSDVSCKKGHMNPQSNGIQTGRCVNYNATIKTCEVSAWCPVESMKGAPVPAILKSAENFTVLIKNNIHFPKFNHTARNFLPKLNISCTFNKITAPGCPIFRLGDILQATGENFSEMAIQGGIMGIEINWDCNLDKWFHRCSPQYSFRRLDDKTTTEYPGYNFRFAKYYKQPSGKEERTLIKAYGIRFDILVFGTAGQFNIFELLVYTGSVLSYFGLAQFIIDFLITSYTYPCCKESIKEYYFKKKCESALGPKWTLMYVSYVDDPHIILVDKPLRTSLQNVKGEIVQGENMLFIMTNLIITLNQTQGYCPELPDKTTVCNSSKDCSAGYVGTHSNGMKPTPAFLKDAENFTILVKNNIWYPKFNFTRRNILPSVSTTYLKTCIYDPKTDPFCPIFRVRQIVEAAGQNFQEMAVEGGVMGVQINWNCDLDKPAYYCVPEYTFRRLDSKDGNHKVSPGYNFRFAKYYKDASGTDSRTLIKAYGIRFDIMVFGKAGKFDIIPTMINIGSGLALFGVATVLCDIVVLYFMKKRYYYREKKYKYVEDYELDKYCNLVSYNMLLCKRCMQRIMLY